MSVCTAINIMLFFDTSALNNSITLQLGSKCSICFSSSGLYETIMIKSLK